MPRLLPKTVSATKTCKTHNCYRDRLPPHHLIFSLGVLEVVCSEIEIASVEAIGKNE